MEWQQVTGNGAVRKITPGIDWDLSDCNQVK